MCDLLAATGIAGSPNSFFRQESFPWWANNFQVSVENWRNEHEFDHSYLSAVQQHGKNGTPVFGMRLMWESVADLSDRLASFYPDLPNDKARFQSAFGSPLYLHLYRNDKIAQAASLLKAEQTGLWHVFADGTERERLKPGQAPAYDARALSELVATLEDHDSAWTRWFAQQKVEPVCIRYETLSAEPQAVLATVLSALGLDSSIAATVKPETTKLADNKTSEWITRYRKEKAGPGPPT